MRYTVHEVSKIAGISIRTLHYYDQIGLLSPSVTGENRYRYYEEKELVKLQFILFFRELEVPLADIKKILHSKHIDTDKVLSDQKKLLTLKKKKIENLILLIDRTKASLKGGETMNTDDMFGSFTNDEYEQYKDEARKRWGNTDAYEQSMKRMKGMTKEDFAHIENMGRRILSVIANNMDKKPSDPVIQEQVHLYRTQYIGAFYECSIEVFSGLGMMYVEDERFSGHFEKQKEGLAHFMSQAIAHYCTTHEQ